MGERVPRASTSDVACDSQIFYVHVPARAALNARPDHQRVVALTHHAPFSFKHFTRPPLAHLMLFNKMSHSFPLHSGRSHFFKLISFNIKLSSMLSASNFLSLEFSSSSCLSLRASLTSMPPSRAFHFKNVALPIACLRHRSATSCRPLAHAISR